MCVCVGGGFRTESASALLLLNWEMGNVLNVSISNHGSVLLKF